MCLQVQVSLGNWGAGMVMVVMEAAKEKEGVGAVGCANESHYKHLDEKVAEGREDKKVQEDPETALGSCILIKHPSGIRVVAAQERSWRRTWEPEG